MNDIFVDNISKDPLVKIGFAKIKMMTQLSMIFVCSADTSDYKPGQHEAPTKGFMQLDRQLMKFLKNGDIRYDQFQADPTLGWRDYDYTEDHDANYKMEGHMLVQILAGRIGDLEDWLTLEVLVRYVAECYEILREWRNNRHLDFGWYKFARLIRNAVNHNYRFNYERIKYFENNDRIEYQNKAISKEDEGKHILEWQYSSPWLMLRLTKDMEKYLRDKIKGHIN